MTPADHAAPPMALIDQAEAALARLRAVASLRVAELDGYMVPLPAMAELDRLNECADDARGFGSGRPVRLPRLQIEATLIGGESGRRFGPLDVVARLAFVRARDNHNGDGARWAKIRDEWDAAWDAAKATVGAHAARSVAIREANDFVPRHGRES